MGSKFNRDFCSILGRTFCNVIRTSILVIYHPNLLYFVIEKDDLSHLSILLTTKLYNGNFYKVYLFLTEINKIQVYNGRY